jgi:class 3 adenylate cyclase/uncharacterized small protein (DUF1192 family)
VPDLPRGTVTFAFTDIEGSTELLKALGEQYAEVLSEHRRIIRGAFGSSDGIEIDTQGDAFFYVFPRARDALGAAVEAQRAHAGTSWPAGASVLVRMGLHTGEPAVHEEGYVGLDVVRAARICTVGRGGQILLSETTRALLGSELPEGVSVFPLGQRNLRGIDEPERVFEVAIDDLEHEGAHEDPAASAVAEQADAFDDAIGRDVERGFEDLGSKFAAGIQESILRTFAEKLDKAHVAPGSAGGDSSAVDEIAARVASLTDEIDARIKAALAKKGIAPDKT